MDCAGGGTLNGKSRCTGSYHLLRLARPAEDSSYHDCTCSDHSTCACTNKRTLPCIPQRGRCAASVTTEYLEAGWSTRCATPCYQVTPWQPKTISPDTAVYVGGRAPVRGVNVDATSGPIQLRSVAVVTALSLGPVGP